MAIKMQEKPNSKPVRSLTPHLRRGLGLGLRERAPFLVTLYRYSVITKQDRRIKSMEVSDGQGFGGAYFGALLAEDAFCGIFATAGVLVYLYFHRTCFQALSAFDTFIFVALDSEQGIVAHWLEEYGYGADVFAEGTIVFQKNRKQYADYIIDNIPNHEQHEHGVGISLFKPEKKQNDRQ